MVLFVFIGSGVECWCAVESRAVVGRSGVVVLESIHPITRVQLLVYLLLAKHVYLSLHCTTFCTYNPSTPLLTTTLLSHLPPTHPSPLTSPHPPPLPPGILPSHLGGGGGRMSLAHRHLHAIIISRRTTSQLSWRR
jgi:hypothetical protein